ncbi:MAG: ATP-grasp domain-containing protein [Candidatus Paracaedibacteraceae bacterium]|nr:ATP-grasp domain-containing protein [Candidatus Paracaedibacteraceae bacterium]
MILVLSRYVKDDLESIFRCIPKENRFLITSKKDATEEKKTELKNIFKEVVFVDEYYDSSEVEIEALKLHKAYRYNRIVTPANGESDLIRAASLRSYLNLEGQSYESALAFRDKFIMKEEVSKAGIKTPEYSLINSTIDLLNFVDRVGYPIIIKPLRGVASINTRIFRTNEELINFLKLTNFSFEKIPMLAESYIEGKMFHVDGIVINGEVKAIWPSIYIGTAMDMVNGSFFANHLLSKENPMNFYICEFAKRVLSALPTPKSTVFHLELFQNRQNDLIFCEIASRAGGGYTNSIWTEAFEIPLRDIFYKIQAGLEIPKITLDFVPSCIPSSVVLPKKSGKIIKISQKCPLDYVSRYKTFFREGDITEETTDTMSPILSSLIIGESEGDIINKISGFLKWTEETMKYETQE